MEIRSHSLICFYKLRFILDGSRARLLSIIGTLLISLIVMLFLILIRVIVNVIPKNAEELLAETYPEYRMVN